MHWPSVRFYEVDVSSKISRLKVKYKEVTLLKLLKNMINLVD